MLFSSEAKYSTLGEWVKEAWFTVAVVSIVCLELSVSNLRILEDNQGAVALAESYLSSAWSKHIDVRFDLF